MKNIRQKGVKKGKLLLFYLFDFLKDVQDTGFFAAFAAPGVQGFVPTARIKTFH